MDFVTDLNSPRESFGILSQGGEGRMKDLVGHQFRREQPLKIEAFGQDVYHPYKVIGGHGEIFFFGDRAKPLRSERITLGRELGNLGAQLLMRERIGQAR
jgi:hypothetical protein